MPQNLTIDQYNFMERFAPLSSLEGHVIEVSQGQFILAPEGMISYNEQPDHVVVWYRRPGEDHPRFSQMREFIDYQRVMTALLPIDLPIGCAVPRDLMAVLESAPEEVLVEYTAWADDFSSESSEERYPNVNETWTWLNSRFGE